MNWFSHVAEGVQISIILSVLFLALVVADVIKTVSRNRRDVQISYRNAPDEEDQP